VFTGEATKAIMSLAIELSQTYSSVVPIIQSETIRIKLAKLAAAVAARVFSTDLTYQKVVVKGAHVRCVKELLQQFYNKPSMSYHLFSRSSVAATKIEDFAAVVRVIKEFSTRNELATVTGLLDVQKITVEAIADYVGDLTSARDMLGDLVIHKCLTRLEGHNYYLKNSAFKQWLLKRKAVLTKKG
jgi:hypothetical protein